MRHVFSPDLLRSKRNAARLTQTDLASRIGTDVLSVGNWEAGTHEPRLRSFLLLCHVFECDLTDLLIALDDLPTDNEAPCRDLGADDRLGGQT